MQHLDTEKREREAHEVEITRKQEDQRREKEALGEKPEDETAAHKNREIPKGKTRMVTDPITGRDIEVEDQDEDSMEPVKNPTVCHF